MARIINQPTHRDTDRFCHSRILSDIELAASGDEEARVRLRVTALRLRWMGRAQDAARFKEILRAAALSSLQH